MTTFKLDAWKFSTVFLLFVLLVSWVWMIISFIVNDSALDSVRSQQTTLRELNSKMVLLEVQMQDLQSRNKALNEKLDAFNTLRQRDVEYLQSQLTRGPIKNIR